MGKYLGYLLWLPGAVLLGVALGTSNYVMLFAAISLVVFPVMFINIQVMIYALILSVTFLPWFYNYLALLPRQLTWLPDILCIILLLRVLFDLASKQIRLRNTFITSFVYVWLALAIIGIAVNAVAPPVFLVGLRNYFKFIPLLLVFSWYDFPKVFVKRIIQVLLLVGAIQLPLVIVERIVFPADFGDKIVGSFGANASGILALFELVLFAVLLGLYKSNYYSSRQLMTYASLVLAPTFITEAKIVFFLIPALMLLYLLDFKQQRLAKNVVLAVSGAAILLVGLYTYNRIYTKIHGYNVQTVIFSEQSLLNYLGYEEKPHYAPGEELPRLEAVRLMSRSINKDPLSSILGVGVGNASNSLFEASKGYYYKMHPNLRDDIFASRLGWEFGHAGLILFGVFFFMLYRVKRHQDHDTFYNGLFYGVRGLVFITAASFLYNSFLVLAPLAMLFWMYLGMVNRRLLMEKG